MPLQVLFHARIAEEALHQPFSIDDVADALVRKLGNRVPAVLAGAGSRSRIKSRSGRAQDCGETRADVLHGGHPDRPAGTGVSAEGHRAGWWARDCRPI